MNFVMKSYKAYIYCGLWQPEAGSNPVTPIAANP